MGSVLVFRFTRADTKDQTIHNSYPMTPKQRKNNGYSPVNRYTRTEPTFATTLKLSRLFVAPTFDLFEATWMRRLP